MRCIVGVFDIFTLDCSRSWSFLFLRPKLHDQDQDQSSKTKIKTKTRLARPWSRPRPQPTRPRPRPVFVGLRPVLSQDRGLRPHHWSFETLILGEAPWPANSPIILMMSTVTCNQSNESGQWSVHSTSTPIITALMTRMTTMKMLKPSVLTNQLARMLGGLNREFMIFTRFLRLSADVIRFRDCRRQHAQNVVLWVLMQKFQLNLIKTPLQ